MEREGVSRAIGRAIMPPLSGLTVVALEHAVAAPFATRQLADLGARVIKIERPDGGTSRCLQRFRLRHDRAVCRKKATPTRSSRNWISRATRSTRGAPPE